MPRSAAISERASCSSEGGSAGTAVSWIIVVGASGVALEGSPGTIFWARTGTFVRTTTVAIKNANRAIQLEPLSLIRELSFRRMPIEPGFQFWFRLLYAKSLRLNFLLSTGRFSTPTQPTAPWSDNEIQA